MAFGVRIRARSAQLVAVITLTLASASVGVLPAQVATGDRIRVRTVDRQRLIGKLEYLGADSLRLIDEAGVQQQLARSGITHVEVSRGRHRRVLAGAIVGTLAGAAVGTGIGLALDSKADDDAADRGEAGSNLSCGNRWFDGIEIGVGALLGSGVGLATGLIAGSFPVERWRTVPLTDRVTLLTGRSRLEVSVAFR